MERENQLDESVEQGADSRKVAFHYLKGNYFRSIHLDGAMGSVSPAGHLHLAVYSERRAIPRKILHDADKDGTLIEGETIIDGRDGYVRELEADLVMSKDVALSLAEWIRSAFPDEEVSS